MTPGPWFVCLEDDYAAPDMLAALKQIHHYETIRDPNWGELFLGALRADEAAIPKAEARKPTLSSFAFLARDNPASSHPRDKGEATANRRHNTEN
ncbi:MAG TPA: hypothetical protein VKB89_04710 [Xanthobacteraceae bacterium]|nr:hypothetical protein [Xanthobacteraceae bacterium]